MDEITSTPEAVGATAELADVTADTASEEVQSYDSVDDAVAALDALDADPAPENGAEVKQEDSTDGATQTEGDEAQPDTAQDADAPASWGKDAKELFAKLPLELKQQIQKREDERERFVNARAEETNKAKQAEKAAQDYIGSELQQILHTAQDILDAEFTGIDWLALQRTDPQAFLQLDAARKQRHAQLAAITREQNAWKAQRNQQRQTELAQELKKELEAITPELQKVFGEEYNPATFGGEVRDYLLSMGAPEGHVNGITHGYMLNLVGKAMKYDRLQKAETTAREKIAAAPKLMPSKAAASVDAQGQKQKAARNKFSNNPSSTDAAVAYLNSLEE